MTPISLPQHRKATATMRTLHLVLCFLSAAPLILTATIRGHAQGPSEDPVALEQQFRELVKAGKFDEARPLTGKLIDAVKLRFGSESKEYASALLNIPALALKFPSEADLLTVLRIHENHFGPDDPAIAPILSLLARTYMLNSRRQGNASKLAEAKPMLDRALAILEKEPGPDTAQYADALVVLGEFTKRARSFLRLKRNSSAPFQFSRDRLVSIGERRYLPFINSNSSIERATGTLTPWVFGGRSRPPRKPPSVLTMTRRCPQLKTLLAPFEANVETKRQRT